MAGAYNGGNTVRAKDWIGNTRSVFVCNGASNYTAEERQKDDYYATEPRAVELLLEKEHFNNNIWECACGGGHMSEVLKAAGYTVFSSDIAGRGYKETEIIDYVIKPAIYKATEVIKVGDVVTDNGCHGEVVVTRIYCGLFQGYYKEDGVTVSALRLEHFKKTTAHVDLKIGDSW